jgi:D-xylose 1-dehydrogenase (NADP+, D-xylono-1,5-lactone-forming)
VSNQNVRWGIISTASISERAFIPALRQTQRGTLVGVASRDRNRAEAFAQKHDIPVVFDDYASLLQSDQIDAVYNPLPNSMHAEWTIAAAENGKHVFCEKPLAVNPAQAQTMVDACKKAGVVFFEAFVFLYHPQTLRLRQILDSGRIGKLIQVEAHQGANIFYRPNIEQNIRLSKELVGGALMDMGCYPITFARFAFGEEPLAVQADCYIHPKYEVDTRDALILSFPGDRTAALQTSFHSDGGQSAILFGEDGYIEVSNPYHPPAQSRFVVHSGNQTETHQFDTGVLPFAPAIEHFQDVILDGVEPIITAQNATGTLAVINAAWESGRTGARVVL